jgi:uncharacterized protein YbjQ (UPF0145 family)
VAYQGGFQSGIPRVNAEMQNYTAAIYHARELAMDRMQAEALSDGASGIVGVKISEHARNWDNHVFEFQAVGTGIRKVADGLPRPETRFTLSLDEAPGGA